MNFQPASSRKLKLRFRRSLLVCLIIASVLPASVFGREYRFVYFEAGPYPVNRTLQSEYRDETIRLAPDDMGVLRACAPRLRPEVPVAGARAGDENDECSQLHAILFQESYRRSPATCGQPASAGTTMATIATSTEACVSPSVRAADSAFRGPRQLPLGAILIAPLIIW